MDFLISSWHFSCFIPSRHHPNFLFNRSFAVLASSATPQFRLLAFRRRRSLISTFPLKLKTSLDDQITIFIGARLPHIIMKKKMSFQVLVTFFTQFEQNGTYLKSRGSVNGTYYDALK